MAVGPWSTVTSPPEAKALTGEKEIDVTLTRAGGGKRILTLTGSSLADSSDEYRVTATISRIPCSGHFVYLSSGADPRGDAATEFHAIVRLERMQTVPPGLPCGGPVPEKAGKRGSEVILSHEETVPFSLDVWPRKPHDPFNGILTLNGIPVCNQPYRLKVTLTNRDSRRTYRYGATVTAAVGYLNHSQQDIPSCDPPELP